LKELVKEMNQARPYDVQRWRELLKELDPNIHERLLGILEHQHEKHRAVPRKYQELIYVAVNAAIRNMDQYRAHCRLALEHGATSQELFEATFQAWVAASFRPLGEALLTMDEAVSEFRQASQ